MAPKFLELVDEILDEYWEGKREVDAVCYLVQEVPDPRVFGHLLAIPKVRERNASRARRRPTQTTARFNFYDPKFMQSRAEFIHKLVQMRKGQSGGQDLISLAIAAHERDEKIDDLELFGMVMVLVTGGIGTTSDLISGAIYQMLRRPALYEADQARPLAGLAAARRDPALRRADSYSVPGDHDRRRSRRLADPGAHAGMRRQRRGRPRSAQVPQSRRVRSSPATSTTTSASARVSISASAPRPPGSKPGSRSKEYWSVSPGCAWRRDGSPNTPATPSAAV